MAFWITHLRIADIILAQYGSRLSEWDFIVGSLAPDSGMLNPDHLTYTPSRHILHRTSEDGKTIYYKEFAEEYGISADSGRNRRSFLYGYYTHLFTDHLWATGVYLPLVDENIVRFRAEKGFRQYMKGTVESCDRYWLRENRVRSLEYLREMIAAGEGYDGDYLDYITPAMLTNKLGEICRYYTQPLPDIPDESYYSCEKLNGFVDSTAALILADELTAKLSENQINIENT